MRGDGVLASHEGRRDRGRETGRLRPDPGGRERSPRGKSEDRVGRPHGFGLPNDRMVWPEAKIDEGGLPWEIGGIPPGFWVSK
jgi:hypothetical protein